MSKLNEKTEKTKKIIHLMVTSLCNRNCPHCCNKQYSLDDVPYVSDEELREAEILCLTGGEPFLFSHPCEIASHYKNKYKNIKKVYVYTNAAELSTYLSNNILYGIDGVNVSIKTIADANAFKSSIEDNASVQKLQSNYLYVFDNLYDDEPDGFSLIHREWQEDFVPSDDSIFRKV